MSEHTAPSVRLQLLFDQQRQISAEIVTALLELVTATGSATAVAGYSTLQKQLETFIDAGGLGFESLQALYAEQQTHLRTMQQELRELAAERRAAGAELGAQLAEVRALLLPPEREREP